MALGVLQLCSAAGIQTPADKKRELLLTPRGPRTPNGLPANSPKTGARDPYSFLPEVLLTPTNILGYFSELSRENGDNQDAA